MRGQAQVEIAMGHTLEHTRSAVQLAVVMQPALMLLTQENADISDIRQRLSQQSQLSPI